MLQRTLVILAITGTSLFLCHGARAADQDRTQEQTQAQEQVFGSQLMTPQERAEYRNRLRTAKTQEERDRIRAEHHQQMMERAKERGVSLPDKPPTRGQGMGPGGGMGGGGMGGGRNR